MQETLRLGQAEQDGGQTQHKTATLRGGTAQCECCAQVMCQLLADGQPIPQPSVLEEHGVKGVCPLGSRALVQNLEHQLIGSARDRQRHDAVGRRHMNGIFHQVRQDQRGQMRGAVGQMSGEGVLDHDPDSARAGSGSDLLLHPLGDVVQGKLVGGCRGFFAQDRDDLVIMVCIRRVRLTACSQSAASRFPPGSATSPDIAVQAASGFLRHG